MKVLPVGIAKKIEKTVAGEDTALARGSGRVEVLATPVMIALMEEAAFTLVEPYLEDGQTTVGTEVNVRHLAATPVGMRIEVEAVLTGVEGKRLFFKVVARDAREVIGTGTHERYLVSKERFLTNAVKK